MKKKQIGTIFLLVITAGLIGAIIYFNALLNDKGPTSVTQIRKTKASAITYHKFLALNTTPIPESSSSSSSNSSQSSMSQLSSSAASEGLSSSSSGFSSLPSPSPTSGLIAYRQASSQSSVSGMDASASSASFSSVSSVGSGMGLPTAAPTLLVYRTVTTGPTLIPPAETGGGEISSLGSSSSKKKASSSATSIAPTRSVPTPAGADKQLPQTGWVQICMIFFIVAAATVFVSFLF